MFSPTDWCPKKTVLAAVASHSARVAPDDLTPDISVLSRSSGFPLVHDQLTTRTIKGNTNPEPVNRRVISTAVCALPVGQWSQPVNNRVDDSPLPRFFRECVIGVGDSYKVEG